MSLLGDFSMSWKRMWLTKLGKKYDMKWEEVLGGKNKIVMNAFQELDKDTEKFIQNNLYLNEHELKVAIINNRSSAFNIKKVKPS